VRHKMHYAAWRIMPRRCTPPTRIAHLHAA
jgi:hypothetical protein